MGEWKYEIGVTINDGRRNMTITDREIRYMSSWKKPCHQKWNKFTCNNCGWIEGWIPEKAIKEGKGCACCKGRVVVKGINDIATKAPYVIPYLVNKEDAYKYTPSASKIIKTKCVFCGEERDYRISQLTANPYVCYRCGKNTSIYERIFYEFLTMYNVDFIPQLSSANMRWCGKYRYDFYIPKLNTIVELNGNQHYQIQGIYDRSFEEIHENDMEKLHLAFKNGIEGYSVFAFGKARKNKIIDIIYNHPIIDELNIDKSNLKQNLDECYKRAFTKKTIEICQYYTSHPELSAKDIGKKFGVSSTKVLYALWDGTYLGICDYDGQEKLKQVRINNNLKKSKSIEIITPKGKSFSFGSIREACRMSDSVFNIHFSRFYIKKHCLNGELFHGYSFKYIDK